MVVDDTGAAMISLSRTQRHAADRAGGVDLILPWPDGLAVPDLDLNEMRPASPPQTAAAVAALDLPRDITLWRVRVIRLRQQGTAPEEERPVRCYLLAGLVGARWLDALRRIPPRDVRRMWSAAALVVDASPAPDPLPASVPPPTPAPPKAARKPRAPGYVRTRANPDRVAQRLWAALRCGEAMTCAELAERAGASPNTAKNYARRWQREDLVEVAGETGGDAGIGTAYLYRLSRDLGPTAPVLRGRVDTGTGYTDPNEEEATDDVAG
ncbi:hypothetical protein AZL_020580 [Azospirillum sp. B510]|uniref:helix-turn-helix domain-containing protein n=1 Tax=Azospirillum sp. (strain B510) TaxID=137722 RepID=UPI0001C4C2E5|nr:helix-turn-helix domain-containing protein [Azospirillum sp. B510]BAI71455.1 hypothetical protein AZL_008170 [Azospirillum sp. B510]BAI72696.1 hypothetical protein AZL_020580 [Azospirillum sp. B510]